MDQLPKNNKSIYDFMQKSKQQRVKEKRQLKQHLNEKTIKSSKSTQMSLIGWLLKNRPKQNCKIVTIPKNMIINIYSYLRVSEIMTISGCCSYLNDCAKSVWNSSQFFGELETDKLTTSQLKKLIEKSSRLSHIKTLKSIYRGKNLRAVRQKIKLKIFDRSDHHIKPLYGNLLQVFQVAPKNHKSSAFLLDNHLSEIVNSSYRSLTTVKLHLCLHIKKFTDLSRCTELTTLEITGNQLFGKEDLKQICKRCLKIRVLDLSGCSNLDQNMFNHISKLQQLQTFTLKNYNESFGDLTCLNSLTQLSKIDIENTCIVDQEMISMARVVQLKELNITGCKLLTDYALKFIKNHELWINTKIQLNRTNFSQEALHEFQQG